MKRVAFAGTVAVDEIIEIESLPQKHQLANILRKYRVSGGLISNCAIGLSQIDPRCNIKLFTIVGDDDNGKFLMDEYSNYPNIDTGNMLINGITPYTMVLSDQRDKSRTFLFNKGNSKDIDQGIVTNLDFDFIHVGYPSIIGKLDEKDDEYGCGLGRLLERLKSEGKETSLDLVSSNEDGFGKRISRVLKYVDYLFLNELECENMTGLSIYDSEGDLDIKMVEEGLNIIKEMGVERFVIFHCPLFCVAFDGRDYYKLHSIKIETDMIHGTVGAGDSFAAGCIYGIICDKGILESMKMGIGAATSLLLSPQGKKGIAGYLELEKLYDDKEKVKVIL